jgi:hypothetical protein
MVADWLFSCNKIQTREISKFIAAFDLPVQLECCQVRLIRDDRLLPLDNFIPCIVRWCRQPVKSILCGGFPSQDEQKLVSIDRLLPEVICLIRSFVREREMEEETAAVAVDTTPLMRAPSPNVPQPQRDRHQILAWHRVPGSTFNLVNATIGAGILGLPRMVALCGLVLGPLLIAIFGLLTNYSLRILHQVSLLSGHPTYEMVARHMYNRYLGLGVTVAIIVICWGAMIAYMIVIADCMLIKFFSPRCFIYFFLVFVV